MARDSVTIREEEREGETVWTFWSVGRTRLKCAPAKVTRRDGRARKVTYWESNGQITRRVRIP